MELITSRELMIKQADNEKILVDFYAEWCGPCKTLIPRLEKIETTYPDVKFVKINIDDNMEYVTNMGIRSVPTVMVFNGQEIIDRSSGVNTEKYYTDILDKI